MNTSAESAPKEAVPRVLRLVRILVLIELTRFAGLILFSGIQNGSLPATAALFGVGDALVAVTAIPVWYLLGKPGVLRYGLAMVWVTFGLVDLIYALGIAALGGQLGALSALLGPGIVLVPFNIVIQSVTLGLLLSRPVAEYLARTPAM